MLLDRNRKPVSATPTGHEILVRAREAMTILQDIPSYVEERKQDLSGTLRLGIIPTLSQYLLPLFLQPFLEAHRGLDIEIHETDSEHMLEELREIRLDCGILALPTGVTGLTERPLFYEEFMAYLPPDHPQGDGGASIILDRLGWDEMLLLSEGHCLRDQVIDLCGRSRERSNRLAFETGSIESLKALVDQGLGYTLLPELATANLPSEREAQLYRLAAPRPSRRIGLVFHPGLVRVRLLEALEEAIMAGLPEKVRRNQATAGWVPWR